MSQEDDNRKLIERFMVDFSSGGPEKIAEYLADDATWWTAGSLEGLSGTLGKQDWVKGISGVASLVKGGAITLSPKAFTTGGDRVAVETESYAELNNGRVYQNQYHFLFVVRDSKIVEAKEYMDTDHARKVFLDP
ncbi:nuclear transport factor 2 family protein [Cumulibacter soli]|uniref:nuclear transport factor 2 family protein n=1 Tax=Cumulibacter soli TaxID=2546344 RepID=UPI001ABB44C6|nr:nuclear transport factor 2 family protein [Cumulibacter soli]